MSNKTYLALGLTALIVILMVGLFFAANETFAVLGWKASAGADFARKYLPETIIMGAGDAGMPDRRAQILMYFFGLSAIYGAFFVISFYPVKNFPALNGLTVRIIRTARWAVRSPLMFLLGLVLVWLVAMRQPAGGQFFPLSYRALAVGLAGTALIGWLARTRMAPTIAQLAAYVLVFVVISLELPGLLVDPRLNNQLYYWYTVVQMHFAAVIGPADRIGNGLRLYDDAYPYYGVLQTALVGLAVKWFGPLSWASFYRIVQGLQVAMLVAVPIALALWSFGRRHVLQWLVVPCLFILPYAFCLNWMNWFPNHTGWRYLNLALAPIALFALRETEFARAGKLFGVVSAIALAYNRETGVVVLCGFVGFLATASQRPSLAPAFKALWRLLLCACVTLLVLGLCYRAAFGYWPLPTSLAREIDYYETLSTPWFGFELKGIDVIAVIIFVHAATIVIESSLKWRDGVLTPIGRVRLAIATMILIWFSYYTKLPQTRDLDGDIYLYAFLIPLSFSPRRLAFGWQHGLPKAAAFLLVPVLLIAFTVDGWMAMAHDLHDYYGMSRDREVVKLSGVWVRRDIGEYVEQQAAFLQNFIGDRGVYITNSGFVMPIMTGLYPHLPSSALFNDIFSRYQFDGLIKRIQQIDPDYILFDTLQPDGQQAFGVADHHDNLQRFYERIQSAVSGTYQFAGQNAGWDIWRRK